MKNDVLPSDNIFLNDILCIIGDAVAISGNIVVVGAKGSAHGSHAESGAAFVFSYEQAEWKFTHTLTAPHKTAYEKLMGFGHSVDIDHETIVVTSHSDNGTYWSLLHCLEITN